MRVHDRFMQITELLWWKSCTWIGVDDLKVSWNNQLECTITLRSSFRYVCAPTLLGDRTEYLWSANACSCGHWRLLIWSLFLFLVRVFVFLFFSRERMDGWMRANHRLQSWLISPRVAGAQFKLKVFVWGGQLISYWLKALSTFLATFPFLCRGEKGLEHHTEVRTITLLDQTLCL